MSVDNQQLDRAAKAAEVDIDLLHKLLALESLVPDLPSVPARNRLAQKVEEILDNALSTD